MSTALGLAMQISANTAQLAQAVQDVNKRLDEMGQAGKKAADDLGTLKNIELGKLALGGIQAAGGAFLSLSKSVLGATESIINFGKSVADELDSLNDVANRTGVGVEALQAYGAAAKLSGTDIETFAKSLQKLTINIGNAVGDEKAQKAFEKLGLSFDELREKSPTEQFEAVADAIAKISDPAERAAAAVKLFGKGGIELGPLFAEGPGALAKMREEAEALGQVVSEDAISSIGRMNDAFDKVWMTLKGLTGQIVGELAGPIAQIAEDLLSVVKEVGATNIAQSIASGLIDFIKMAGNAFFTLAKFIEAFVKKFSGVLGLELRTDQQINRDKEIADLQSAIFVARNRGTIGLGLGGGPTLEQLQKRLAELQAQAQEESDAGTLSRIQRNFNNALETAATNLEQRAKPPEMPAGRSPAGAAADSAEASQSNEKQTRLLEDIARNTKPDATVDIVGN